MIKAFIADDHAVIREGLRLILTSSPLIEVIGVADNGRDAVSDVLKLNPDVLIMDISMPEMNGIEAARLIRDRSPKVRIVILSMYASAEYIFHALEAGVHGYILKDAATENIINAVKSVYSGKHYLCNRIAGIVANQVGQRSDTDLLASLSQREREILQLVVEGNSSANIAAKIHISPKTVDTYRSRLMQKLHIKDVVGLVKFAIHHGIIQLE